ncbi:MAG: transglycosylase domain-containing protein [Ktedonobacteraceae bacterium]
MSNNFWQQPQNGNISPSNNDHASSPSNGPTRTGSLLRDYRPQQGPQQQSPALMPPSQASPSYPPQTPQPQLPQRQPQSQAWPSAQSWPTGNRQPGQGWIANTMQMVRRWSGRVVAVPPPVDQNPLVLYRPGAPLPVQKRKPWKRSRTMRITMQMKRRRARWQQGRPRALSVINGILIAFLILLLIGASAGSAYAYKYYQDQLPRLQSLAKQQISQTSRIYDRNWNLLFDAYDSGGRRTPISYNYLPQVLKDAQISSEDPTFWTNSGVDPQAILRAGGQYLQAGGVVSGASTITQQLIKNMTNDTAVTLNRKIPEAVLAIGMTQQYPKTKIMEMYFNVSPYGALDLGVESAVEDYFHLSPQCDKNHTNCIPGVYYLNCEASHLQGCDPTHCDAAHYCDPMLGLARASLLAGMPQDPPTYDPTQDNVDSATGVKYYLERQQYVLNQMLKYNISIPGLGPITQDMASQAEAMTAKMKFPAYTHPYYHGCQHFVQWVIKQLEAQLGVNTFLNGGFNIRTTIDYRLEAYAEKAVQRHLNKPELQPFGYGNGPLNITNNLHDSAVVVMNAKTGEVLAMDGSTNYNDGSATVAGNINMAVSPRQPGSSFKPLVYVTAFQQGLYPGIVLPDYKTYFPLGGATLAQDNYHPQDYGPDGHYNNVNSTIRQATANSYNIPAIKALEYAGAKNVINMARRFGITALDANANTSVLPSLALGTLAIPLIQMVGAYQVFANQGVRVPPRSVLDIWDNYGHHLYHYDPAHPGGVQVITPQLSWLITSILSDERARAAEFAPDHILSFWSPTISYSAQPDPMYPDVAAKTGTTNSFVDNWTLGYTQNVVVGVWSGNANYKPMQNVIGITGAAPIWHSVMAQVNGMCTSDQDQIPCTGVNYGFHLQTFTPPSGVKQQCVSSTNGLAGTSSNCDWMLNNQAPQQTGIVAPTTNPTTKP